MPARLIAGLRDGPVEELMANRIIVCSAVWRRSLILACLMILAVNGSLWAAQRGQGRVFTNEDVETTPPAPAAEEPAAPAAAAESGAAPSAEEAAPPAAPGALQRLQTIQEVLGYAFDDLTAKMQAPTNDAEYSRLLAMRECLESLIADYNTELEQARAEAQRTETVQPAQ